MQCSSSNKKYHISTKQYSSSNRKYHTTNMQYSSSNERESIFLLTMNQKIPILHFISICKLKIFTGTHTALKMRKFSEPIFRSFFWHRLQILSCSKAERGKRIFSGQFKISPLLLNIGWQGLFENYFNNLVSLNRQQRGTFTNSSQPIWIHRQSFKYIWHLAHYTIAKTNQSSTGCGCVNHTVMCIFFAILKRFFFV